MKKSRKIVAIVVQYKTTKKFQVGRHTFHIDASRSSPGRLLKLFPYRVKSVTVSVVDVKEKEKALKLLLKLESRTFKKLGRALEKAVKSRLGKKK